MAQSLQIGIIWQRFGPVHDGRLGALRRLLEQGGGRAMGIEIASLTSTYDWEAGPERREDFFTLLPGMMAEQVSAGAVYWELVRLLRRERIQVLLVPSYWPASSLACLVAAKTMGVKTVMMNDSHRATGRNSGLVYAIKQWLVGRFDAALVAGSLHTAFFRELGMPESRIFDGYDTVENEHFDRVSELTRQSAVEARTRLGLPEKFFLSLGRFVPKKNLERVLEAYAQLVREGRQAGHDLVFVGSGPLRETLMDRARGLGLTVVEMNAGGLPSEGEGGAPRLCAGATVYFHPFAQIDRVPSYYALARAFILASSVEEWGLVVNEAMACSCPVLVSDRVGAAPDLVVEGVTGHRFDPENPGQLAVHLARLAADPGYAEVLGRGAAEHISGWSNERFARHALQAAEAALRGGGGSGSSSTGEPQLPQPDPRP
jgi:glycosyltransferase involved in cell wall biosynthesis